MEITIIKENEKLNKAYNLLVNKIDGICEQYQLSFFELYGILEAIKCDLFNQQDKEI